LDEVRFGILQNLAATLRLLSRPEQLGVLPKIAEFLKMDNNRNWRFRLTLSEQIIDFASIYEPSDIKEHLLPIAFTLLKDKVAEVRLGAIRLLSTLTRLFFCDAANTEHALLDHMTHELVNEITTFVSSTKWSNRQVYVLLCEQLLLDSALPSNLFFEYFLPKLLALSTDNVPNVRLALSRCLAQTYVKCDALQPKHEQVLETLRMLKNDSDADVRRYAENILSAPEAAFSETVARINEVVREEISETAAVEPDIQMNCEEACNE